MSFDLNLQRVFGVGYSARLQGHVRATARAPMAQRQGPPHLAQLPILTAEVPPSALLNQAVRKTASTSVCANPRHPSRPVDTLMVPRGAVMQGNIEARCIHIQGTVYGRVTATSGALVVGRGGIVFGSVCGAGDVVIAGQVQVPPGGRTAVQAHGRLHLAASARVRGQVRYAALSWCQGALVSGAMGAWPR
jgi:cytoskeletal protein CcmA (bactofilin family)